MRALPFAEGYCAPRMRKLTLTAVVCLVAALIAGCGSKQPPGATPSAQRPQRPPSRAQTLSRTMVSAVVSNKSAALPVQVRFSLGARPKVAEPLDIGLVVLPTSSTIDRLSGKIVTDDGLEVVGSAEITPTDHPAEGVPIERGVKLLPQRDGIFTFNAVITVDSGTNTSTQSFSMPLIVGAGTGAQQPAPASSAGTGSTQAAATH
jgi:hypothetical protein